MAGPITAWWWSLRSRKRSHEQYRGILGHREAQHRRDVHQCFEEAPSEVSLGVRVSSEPAEGSASDVRSSPSIFPEGARRTIAFSKRSNLCMIGTSSSG